MIENLLFWMSMLIVYTWATNFFLHRLVNYLKERQKSQLIRQIGKHEYELEEKIEKFTYGLGYLEILSYIIAWLLGYPMFIAIWLGIKVVGRWSEKTHSSTVNIFLIGNLLSVYAGFFGGMIFKWLRTW